MQMKDKIKELDPNNLPEHVAIIPDGNGRWAKKQDLERTKGHKKGAEAAEELIKFAAKELRINYLTFFAFSTENWSRPQEEVNFLMELLESFLKNNNSKLMENDIKFRVIGDLQKVPQSIKEVINRVVKKTSDNSSLQLNMALNYGGRKEILEAVNKLISLARSGKLKSEEIGEKTFESYLYTSETPDPDLLIRTSGEKRLSNFLLWQLAYTEIWTTETLWPDFSPGEFLNALLDYKDRERRYGKIEKGKDP